MRFTNITIFIMLLCSLTAGEETESMVFGNDAQRILGEWRWIRTTGGIAGVNETPSSTGRTASIHFAATHQDLFEKGTEVRSSEYHLGKAITMMSPDSLPVLYWGDSLAYGYTFCEDDTLALWDNVIDGFFFSYCRE